MSTIIWKKNLTLKIDVNSVRDYTLDFSAWLKTRTIASVGLTPTNCSVTQRQISLTTFIFRIEDSLDNASCTFRVTTDTGEVEDFSILFILEVR